MGTESRIIRRNSPGTRAENWCNWPPQAFEEMEPTTLRVQQYIQQIIREDPSAIERILRPPQTLAVGVWKYEHLRCDQ
ncbi:unnamed protein product [Cyprideis torosa]|uniref:Uncharacterized protein n=1 Tax=Cyprideis torosa TaxID=163714 RepID=A0A7R8ZT60_9CRUS|nr:unnamed protein product [Cyprideis torosa]CAG0907722.1 unnamed protein product [Cyprideis torosa]